MPLKLPGKLARTTDGRNTPKQIAEDASDLATAADKDLEHHAAELHSRGMPEERSGPEQDTRYWRRGSEK